MRVWGSFSGQEGPEKKVFKTRRGGFFYGEKRRVRVWGSFSGQEGPEKKVFRTRRGGFFTERREE